MTVRVRQVLCQGTLVLLTSLGADLGSFSEVCIECPVEWPFECLRCIGAAAYHVQEQHGYGGPKNLTENTPLVSKPCCSPSEHAKHCSPSSSWTSSFLFAISVQCTGNKEKILAPKAFFEKLRETCGCHVAPRFCFTSL